MALSEKSQVALERMLGALDGSVKTKDGSDPFFRYLYNDNIISTYTCYSRTIERDMKEYSILQGRVGTISDAFILQVITLMGVVDIKALFKILTALKKANPELQIFNGNIDGLRKRLRSFIAAGLCYKAYYNTEGILEETDVEAEELVPIEDKGQTVVLYGTLRDGHVVSNKTLMKTTSPKEWFLTSHLMEVVGAGSCANTVGRIVESYPFFSGIRHGVFKTKLLSKASMNCEMVFQDGERQALYGVISSYLFHDKRVHTRDEYVDTCVHKVNTVRNYMHYIPNQYRMGNGDCMYEEYGVIVTCADYEDLKTFCHYYADAAKHHASYGLDMNFIYMTGEGVLKGLSEKNATLYIKMRPADNEEGYELYPSQLKILER